MSVLRRNTSFILGTLLPPIINPYWLWNSITNVTLVLKKNDPNILFSDFEPRYSQTEDVKKLANVNPTICKNEVYMPSAKDFTLFQLDCDGLFSNPNILL